jgi:hypothetical protein
MTNKQLGIELLQSSYFLGAHLMCNNQIGEVLSATWDDNNVFHVVIKSSLGFVDDNLFVRHVICDKHFLFFTY